MHAYVLQAEKCSLILYNSILGYTSLIIATREGHLEVVKHLIEHGADIHAQSSDGNFF